MSKVISAVPVKSTASAVMDSVKAAANTVGQTLQSPLDSSKDIRPSDVLDEKRHQEILRQAKLSLNKPVGVLSVHIKQAEIIDLNPTGVFSRPDLTVYIRIHIGEIIKCTCGYDGVTAPTTVVFDTIKQFPVEVSPKRDDESNNMKLEIMAFEKDASSRHHILAVKEMHIYDIIKKQYCMENIDMYRQKKPVAVIDVEICFTYGVFGYGYSNQFENRQRSAKDQVVHSMFCREDPPAGRTDGFRNIMVPQPTGHPAFIHFSQKVDIGDTVREFKSEMSLHDWQTVEEPVLLVSRIKRRMHRMLSEYSDQPTRKSRIAYLTNLVRNNVPPSEGKKGVIVVPDGFKLRRREHRRSLGINADGDADSGLLHSVEGSADKEDLEALSKVMQHAPGIVSRQRVQEFTSKSHKKREDVGQERQDVATVKVEEEAQNDSSCPGWLAKLLRSRANRSNTVSVEVPTTSKDATPTAPAKAATEEGVKENTQKPTESTDLGDTLGSMTDRQASKFGSRLAHRSKLMQGRKSSMKKDDVWNSRRASFLESAAVRLRALVTHDEEEPVIEIPKITIMPSTPEEEFSDLED